MCFFASIKCSTSMIQLLADEMQNYLMKDAHTVPWNDKKIETATKNLEFHFISDKVWDLLSLCLTTASKATKNRVLSAS